MGGKISGRIKKAIKGRLKTAKGIIFFLDYDGTLTPIKPKPHQAKISKSTKTLLKKLAKKTNGKVFILSGRGLADVKKMLGVPGLCYIGNHGIEVKGPGISYIHPPAKALEPILQKCYRVIKKNVKAKGIALENKKYTLSLHYRGAQKKEKPGIKKAFWKAIEGLLKTGKIKVTSGKEVLEVRPNIKWDKGKILRRILKNKNTKFLLPICIGDDITDEDAFGALGKKGISILVSKKKRNTQAQYRLASVKEVINLLKWCINECLD